MLNKKLTAILLVLSILMMPFAALAATSFSFASEAESLKDIGLFLGTSKGLELESKLTRLQGMVLTIRAMGKETEVKNMSTATVESVMAGISDQAIIQPWGRPYAAYAIQAGVTKGTGTAKDGKIIFSPENDLSGTMMATFLLRAMGYSDTEPSTSMDRAVVVNMLPTGLVVKFGTTSKMLRDDAAGMLYLAVKYGNTSTGKKLIEDLIDLGAVTQDSAASAGFVAMLPATPTPIPAVSAAIGIPNGKQVTVTYNRAMHADDIKDPQKYIILDKGLGANLASSATFTPNADNTAVVITLSGDLALTNQAQTLVTIAASMRDAQGVALPADISEYKLFVDATAPTFVRAEIMGERHIRLYWSEPVKIMGNTNDVSRFVVKNSTYTWQVQSVTANAVEKYLEIRLMGNLLPGAFTVEVKNTVGDVVGLMAANLTQSLTYSVNMAAPQATITGTSPGQMTVHFDKPVYGQLDLKFNEGAVLRTNSATVSASSPTQDWTITMDIYRLPVGQAAIMLSPGGSGLRDAYGNSFQTMSLYVIVPPDTTAPALVSAALSTSQDALQLTFSETLLATEALKTSNYTLVDASGIEVPFSVNHTGKTVSLRPTTAFVEGRSYTGMVKLAQDLDKNTMAQTPFSFVVKDITKPTISADSFSVSADGRIYLIFSEDMVQSEMLKPSNYMVMTDSTAVGSLYRTLQSTETVTALDGKGVLIDLTGTVNKPKLLISTNITDLSGLRLAENNLQFETTALGEELFSVTTAQIIGKDLVRIKFSKALGFFQTSDFKMTTNSGQTQLAITGVESQSENEVVLKVNASFNTDGTEGSLHQASYLTVNTAKSVTVSKLGSSLTNTTAIVLSDAYPVTVALENGLPKVISAISSGTTAGKANLNTIGEIRITFTEKIEGASLSILTWTVTGYAVTAVSVTDTATESIVKLTVKATQDQASTTPKVTQVNSLMDKNGVLLAPGSSWDARQ